MGKKTPQEEADEILLLLNKYYLGGVGKTDSRNGQMLRDQAKRWMELSFPEPNEELEDSDVPLSVQYYLP